MKRRLWIAIAGIAVIAAITIGILARRSTLTGRVYKIGFENDPPFHFADENGNPAGLVVDIVGEAARRSGVQICWVRETHTADDALRSGTVDLWPLMAIRPERRAYLHLTSPYRENEACLIVRAERPYQSLRDLDGNTVVHNARPIFQHMLRDLLPRTRFTVIEDSIALIEAVCRGEADAAYMDAFSAMAALLGGMNCSGQKLRVINVPETTNISGIGSTFEAAAAADRIRGAISDMADEGKLAALVSKWSYFTARSMELNEALVHAQRRTRYMVAAVTGTSLLLLFVAWQAFRIRHQRNEVIRAEAARRTSEELYAGLFNHMMEGVATHRLSRDSEGKPVNYVVLDVNQRYEEILGFKRDEVVNRSITDIYGVTDPPFLAEYAAVERSGKPVNFETYFAPLKKHFSISVAPMGKDCFATIFADITARKESEKESARLKDHLQQVQRLESVGRLAGGVAHDFNNLLTVINGYSELLIGGSGLSDVERNHLQQVQEAGRQAASLTQQLLAFSRRQVIQPKVLDLNTVVRDTQEMLRRLVGEDVELITRLEPEPGLVMADPGQMHQVLMNLVANARDAMPKGGKLMIETANIVLDESHVATHAEARCGPCTLLSVSDTGMGIDPSDLPNIFEPFFTTKAKGEGTGLGLAMVYGIVRQNQGWIWTYSEIGKGTTFKIYLPQVQSGKVAPEASGVSTRIASGKETVLLVEDQPNVRALAVRILKSCGYQVLEAASGEEAIRVSQNHSDSIHLLLTDVVLPGMTGKDLADHLNALRPGMKVLFASGYTENIIVHRGVLKPGVRYLSKPYTPQTLAAKVREVLDLS